MAHMSYDDLRTIVDTRIQWLAEIGENNDGINGEMALEWMHKFLSTMKRLEQTRQQEIKNLGDLYRQTVQERETYFNQQQHLTELIETDKHRAQEYQQVLAEYEEAWDILQSQAQEIANRNNERKISIDKADRKIVRLQNEVVRQSEEAERLRRLLQTSESTSAGSQDALSKVATEIKRVRMFAKRELLTVSRRLGETNLQVEQLHISQLNLQDRHHTRALTFPRGTPKIVENIFTEIEKLRELVKGEREAKLKSHREAAHANEDIKRLEELLAGEQESHKQTTASLRTTETEVQRLRDIIAKDRAQLIRERGPAMESNSDLRLFPESQVTNMSGSSGSNKVISWSHLPNHLAEKLRPFNPKVLTSSTMSEEEVIDHFVKACEQEGAIERLGKILSEAEADSWYCFAHVCQYGIHDDRSKAYPKSCGHHESCLIVRRTQSRKVGNLFCRGVQR
ncbi:hypothetical protein F4811DRAFT_498764 [Daldinia bambusicola]|nr:hypothetical protein F4811DRAFT_498764 [Daldinia bambusicola]